MIYNIILTIYVIVFAYIPLFKYPVKCLPALSGGFCRPTQLQPCALSSAVSPNPALSVALQRLEDELPGVTLIEKQALQASSHCLRFLLTIVKFWLSFSAILAHRK